MKVWDCVLVGRVVSLSLPFECVDCLQNDDGKCCIYSVFAFLKVTSASFVNFIQFALQWFVYECFRWRCLKMCLWLL